MECCRSEGRHTQSSVDTVSPPAAAQLISREPLNMSHMVIYRGQDGKPGYQQVDGIHEAVVFVEEMRNREGVEQARIFRLEEVVFEYRPYFRVELSGTDLASSDLSPSDFAPTDLSVADMASTSDSTKFSEVSLVDASPLEGQATRSGDYPFDHPNPELLAAVTREAPYEAVEPSSVLNLDTVEAEVSANGVRRGLFGG